MISRSSSQMEVDQVGGEAGSALLLLSRMADGEVKAAQQQTQYCNNHVPIPSSPATQPPQVKKPVLNIVALIAHIQSLEERVKQLEASSHQRCSCMSKSDLPTPTSIGMPCSNNGISSAPASTTASPIITSPRIPGAPQSLTSIRFNNSSAMKTLLTPINEEGSRQPAPHFIVGQNRGGVPHQISMGMQPNIQSPPSSSLWPGHPGMVLKDATIKDVQRNVLDKVCLPLLERCYDPDKAQLMELVDDLEKHHFYHIDRRILMSAVRRWFRKRREEMGAKIFMLCKSTDLVKVEQCQVREFLRGLKGNHDLLDKVRSRAGLDVRDEAQAREFTAEKIDSFFRRKLVHNSP